MRRISAAVGGAAHPEAAGLIRLFAQHDWMESPFQPLTTTGVPLAPRDDWREVLPQLAEEPSPQQWAQAWRAWCQPRSLPEAQAELVQCNRPSSAVQQAEHD